MDQRLLVSVLAECRPALLRHARRLARDAEPEDLVQAAIVRLLERPPTQQTRQAYGAFLFTTVERLAGHARRRRQPRARATQVEVERARRRASLEERGEPTVEQLALADTIRAVAAQLATLTDLERRAVELVHVEHRSTSEAARRLGTTTKSIDRALRRAYPKLAPLLAASSSSARDTNFLEGPSGVVRGSMEVADTDHHTTRDDEAAA